MKHRKSNFFSSDYIHYNNKQKIDIFLLYTLIFLIFSGDLIDFANLTQFEMSNYRKTLLNPSRGIAR